MPRQTGQTLVFGAEPKTLGQLQNILLRVSNCTWTSRPMTASYFVVTGFAVGAIPDYSQGGRARKP